MLVVLDGCQAATWWSCCCNVVVSFVSFPSRENYLCFYRSLTRNNYFTLLLSFSKDSSRDHSSLWRSPSHKIGIRELSSIPCLIKCRSQLSLDFDLGEWLTLNSEFLYVQWFCKSTVIVDIYTLTCYQCTHLHWFDTWHDKGSLSVCTQHTHTHTAEEERTPKELKTSKLHKQCSVQYSE